MPTDDDIDFLYKTYSLSPKRGMGVQNGVIEPVWEELHHKDPYPFWLD